MHHSTDIIHRLRVDTRHWQEQARPGFDTVLISDGKHTTIDEQKTNPTCYLLRKFAQNVKLLHGENKIKSLMCTMEKKYRPKPKCLLHGSRSIMSTSVCMYTRAGNLTKGLALQKKISICRINALWINTRFQMFCIDGMACTSLKCRLTKSRKFIWINMNHKVYSCKIMTQALIQGIHK